MQSDKKQRQKMVQPNKDQRDNEPQPTDEEQREELNEKSDDATSKFEPKFDLAVIKNFYQVMSFVAPLREKKLMEAAEQLAREVEKMQSTIEKLESLKNPNYRNDKQ